MKTTTKDESIYDRIGGEDGIAQLVESFYERILKDPILSPFFKEVPMDKLERMQREFFAMATGGPADFSGRPLAHVHKHLAIGNKEFQLFTNHLMATLNETTSLSEKDVMDLISRVNIEIGELTNHSGQDE